MRSLLDRFFRPQKPVKHDVHHVSLDLDDWVHVDPVRPSTYAEVLKRNKQGRGASPKPVSLPVYHPNISIGLPTYNDRQWTNADDDEHPDPTDSISRADSANYTLSGRDPTNTFKDLRSASNARHRHRKRLEKYWSFRVVHPGQLQARHYSIGKDPTTGRRNWAFPADLQNAEIVVLTKRDFYNEAQAWPRPPTYSRGRKHIRDYSWTRNCRRKRQGTKFAYRNLQELDEFGCDSNMQFCSTGDPGLLWQSGAVETVRLGMSDSRECLYDSAQFGTEVAVLVVIEKGVFTVVQPRSAEVLSLWECFLSGPDGVQVMEGEDDVLWNVLCEPSDDSELDGSDGDCTGFILVD